MTRHSAPWLELSGEYDRGEGRARWSQVMNHLQGTRSKCLSLDFTFTKRRPSIFLHAISGSGWNAILSLVSSFLILLLASPANSQLAPDVSATAANDRSPVAVSSAPISRKAMMSRPYVANWPRHGLNWPGKRRP